MFTSGTTGRPKGVEITQANYAFAGMVMAEAAGLEAHHRQLVVLPVFPRKRPVLLVRVRHLGRGECGAHAHVLRPAIPRISAFRTRATHASLFAAPMRMILAHGTEGAPTGALLRTVGTR